MIDAKEQTSVQVWQEKIAIPTYEVGKPDPNPCFLENRVYQGSSGAVYPFPVIESVSNEKNLRTYDAYFLENEYLRIMVLPELGGRVQMAVDKTNEYHFVYYNRVIKPALVGLAGPWISGGIEFNWPQHHRPSTFHPVDVDIVANDDGTSTVWCHEIEHMSGTEGMHGFTLYPGKAYLEVRVQLYNRNATPKSFLWWANPAVHVDDNHQSIFPPDVYAVMDHGKRDVSSFPIATGEYYKVDYRPGTDISRYKNIPVPTSYMAYQSVYDFVGSYDHGHQAGLLHIANHHIAPGKKQWTWGCGDFGKAWDRQLTDEDGPYVELMCGVYTDNQPDFSWLDPGEEKAFSQFFMPYKGVGLIKNASIDAAVGVEINSNELVVRVYTTAEQNQARIVVSVGESTLWSQTFDSDPSTYHECHVDWDPRNNEFDVRVALYDSTGNELVHYTPQSVNSDIPAPAKAIPVPDEIESNEALFLAGLHLEQYRHATRQPEDYYREALARDPGDLRCNLALSRLLYQRGLYDEAEKCARYASNRAIRHNANPGDGECYYLLGIILMAKEQFEEAEAALFKATWNANTKQFAWFQLSRISIHYRNWSFAEQRLLACLRCNSRHHQATHLLVVTYIELGRFDKAQELVDRELQMDPFNFGVLFESAYKLDGDKQLFHLRLRDDAHNYIELAIDYAAAGLWKRATQVLELWLQEVNSQDQRSLVLYHLAAYLDKQGQSADAVGTSLQAALTERVGFFPNRLQDLAVLQLALQNSSKDFLACCDLGNLLYSKRRYDEAIYFWERASELNPDFSQPHRNLGIAYYNKRHDHDAAWQRLSKAQSLAPADARILYELDQLAKRLNHNPEERLKRLEDHAQCVSHRDDLFLERITLLNELRRHQEALELLLARQFHPWEGGEGKVPAQYVLCHTEMARQALAEKNPQRAIEHLNQARNWPESLGEGKLPGIQENNLHYWLGIAHRLAGNEQEADNWCEKASCGLTEPTSMQYYNDQPPEMIFYQGLALRALGREVDARQRFERLLEYGRQHEDDKVSIDYFAVSLPDFLIFDVDLELKNRLHCKFMQALGLIGLEQTHEAWEMLQESLQLNVNHLGALTHLYFDSMLAE